MQHFTLTGTCLFIILFNSWSFFRVRWSRNNYKSFETWLQTSKTSILMHLQICNLIRDPELYAICKNVIFLFFHLQENFKSSANRGDCLILGLMSVFEFATISGIRKYFLITFTQNIISVHIAVIYSGPKLCAIRSRRDVVYLRCYGNAANGRIAMVTRLPWPRGRGTLRTY